MVGRAVKIFAESLAIFPFFFFHYRIQNSSIWIIKNGIGCTALQQKNGSSPSLDYYSIKKPNKIKGRERIDEQVWFGLVRFCCF